MIANAVSQLEIRLALRLIALEDRAQPDVDRATAADAKRKALIALRDDLRPNDPEAIERVLAVHGPRAQQLNANRG
ncbi:hypothetical protein GAS19_29530 (plasmid) [Burkholderia glumae]|uniref:hypothetical protein n=1 Tax=Burkholderia glumae TaxID=337 RepID=UPI001295F604|nr:hypothetical protein [Burkholderia glumae]QGA41636.1 hypothetical protein GAS19_29530 [Burkholderia glumae]